MNDLLTMHTLIVRTMTGLEEQLSKEVTELGATDVEILKRAVKCRGGMEVMYRLNYMSRCALRVMKVIDEFEANDEQELYEGVMQFPWESLLDSSKTLAVHAVLTKSSITHSHYAALKTKDAIADRFRSLSGARPSVDLERPDLHIQVHIHQSRCTLLIDSSGDSLHKRGYRRIQDEAPLNEVLAAGMVLLSGWDGSQTLVDPMCGSGTILCEAVMIARNIPPGYNRNFYGFMRWKDYDEEIWERIRKEADDKIIPLKAKVYGRDVNQRTLYAASENITAAGLQDEIRLKQVAFENSSPPDPEGGMIITNPPYGERIKKADILAFYSMIGDVLKKKYTGYTAWLITSDFGGLHSVSLRASRKITLFNGPLECRFVRYDMYSGSKKKHKQQND